MRWLRPWFQKREDELDRELEMHLELEAEERQESGVTPEEAHYAARRAFGNLATTKEGVRSAWGWTALDQLGQDLRYAVRRLRRNPGFTAAAIACLALGIGANTAVFSVINAVMLRSLPVHNAEQLVLLRSTSVRDTPRDIRRTNSGYGRSFPFMALAQLRERNQTLSSIFGFAPLGFNDQSVTVNIKGEVSLAAGEMVSGEFFSGLGVRAILGRVLRAEDTKTGAPQAAVISHSYWSRRFARDPSVIGMEIALDRTPFTIVGVTPQDFFGINPALAPNIWVPLRPETGLTPWGVTRPLGDSMFADKAWWWLMIGGRLKPGVNREQAEAELDLLFRQTITGGVDPAPQPEQLPSLKVVSGSGGLEILRQRLSEPLFVLMAAVGLVLLIACANVATLLLARAVSRQREMSVRLATGASRGRVVRQLLAEGAALAALGGGLGLLFAYWGSQALLWMMSAAGQSIGPDVQVDGFVLAFSAAVCILTVALFGLAPALRATRIDLTRRLNDNTRPSSLGMGLGKALVAGQVALSLVLLIGAGLFVRTVNHLLDVDLGFDRRNLLLFALDAQRGGYPQEQVAGVYHQALESLEAIPGVRSATASTLTLLSGWMNNTGITTDGPELQSGQSRNVYWNLVGPSFFETMGIPVLLGRGIDWADVDGARNVVVVNEALARHFFPNQSPLGRHVIVPSSPDQTQPYEIIGVVGNAKYDNLRDRPPRTMYAPYTMADSLGRLYFEARTESDPKALIPAVREAISKVDPDLPLIDVKTQVDQIREALAQERMFSRLTSLFAALALLLAAVGLYGTLAHMVTGRAKEIGLRMALGAERGAIIWMVLRQSVAMILVGAAIGLPLTFVATRFVASRLYGVEPHDAVTVCAALSILAVVGALAGYLPSRRASRVDPIVALRYE